LKLTMLERRLGLSYAGVAAIDVADAENVTVDVVRRARWRCGRRPDDGLPGSPTGPFPAAGHEGEDFDRMMRGNRSAGL
jgi:hypothetical protein